MIITSTRVSAGDGGNVARHILDKAYENELILEHDGFRELIHSFDDDAKDVKKKYALRHITINPDQAITVDQAREILEEWKGLHGAFGRPHVLVEHRKARADGSVDQHFHAILPEWDPVDRCVMTNRAGYIKNEIVARSAEIRLGHKMTKGRHNAAVENWFRQNGRLADADRMESLLKGLRPNSAFSREQHQAKKREGVDLAQVRKTVRDAWQQSDSGQAFLAALRSAGLDIRKGDKAARFIITDSEGIFLGGAHRLAGVRVADMQIRMYGVDLAQGLSQAPEPVKAVQPHTSAPTEPRSEATAASPQQSQSAPMAAPGAVGTPPPQSFSQVAPTPPTGPDRYDPIKMAQYKAAYLRWYDAKLRFEAGKAKRLGRSSGGSAGPSPQPRRGAPIFSGSSRYLATQSPIELKRRRELNDIDLSWRQRNEA